LTVAVFPQRGQKPASSSAGLRLTCAQPTPAASPTGRRRVKLAQGRPSIAHIAGEARHAEQGIVEVASVAEESSASAEQLVALVRRFELTR
jgi:hypothetical protein